MTVASNSTGSAWLASALLKAWIARSVVMGAGAAAKATATQLSKTIATDIRFFMSNNCQGHQLEALGSFHSYRHNRRTIHARPALFRGEPALNQLAPRRSRRRNTIPEWIRMNKQLLL